MPQANRLSPALGDVYCRQVGPLPISAAEIARFTEAYEFDHPAFSQGVAPASMVLTFVLPPYWVPGGPTMRDGAMPGFAWTQLASPDDEMMATQIDLSFHRELTVGDVLAAEYTLVSETPKRTAVGDGEFLALRVDITNDGDGTEIATLDLTVYRYRPHGGRCLA